MWFSESMASNNYGELKDIHVNCICVCCGSHSTTPTICHSLNHQTTFFHSSLSTNDVLLSSCNFDCNCTSTIFEPVCGADGISYFSPCRGGCQKRILDGVPPPDVSTHTHTCTHKCSHIQLSWSLECCV